VTAAVAARVEVHLVRLDTVPDDHSHRGLDAGELRRAARISLAAERRGFLAAHRVLRALLAERLGCAPEAVAIVAGAGGKPVLVGGGPAFSLSRRDRWCAVALSDDCAVGVDVEPIRPLSEAGLGVADLLPAAARAEVAAAPAEQRAAVLLRWWTRVEAAVKACGQGLDDAVSCVDRAPQLLCETVAGVALSVAGLTRAPLLVDWRLAGAAAGQLQG
jgi:4'-phosphopantetheinyl transferase